MSRVVKQTSLLVLALAFLLPNLWHVCEHHFSFSGRANGVRTVSAQDAAQHSEQNVASHRQTKKPKKHHKSKRCSCNASPSHLTALAQTALPTLPTFEVAWEHVRSAQDKLFFAQVYDNRLPPATGPPQDIS